MTISHLLNETCTLRRQRDSGDIDAYGNQIRAETAVEINKSHFQQVAGTVGANGVYYTARGYLEPWVNITDDDIIEVRNKRFWVNSVQLHCSPLNSEESYLSVELRETAERQVV